MIWSAPEPLKISFINNQVKGHHCPQRTMCTVATTAYEPEERRKRCLCCWFLWCAENGISIEEDEDY